MKLLFNCLLLFTFFKASAQIDKGRITDYFQNEQYREVINYLVPLVTESRDVYALNSLGYAYLMNEEIEEAELWYNKAIAIDSLNFPANKYLAQIKQQKENFTGALIHYKRLIQAQPRNASLYKAVGDLHLTLKDADSSLSFYFKSYQLQPLSVKYAAIYTTQLLNLKNYKTADSIITIFLAIDSTSIPVLMLAVRSAYEKKDYKTAASFSNRWLTNKLDNMNIPTTIRLATANYELKNYLISHQLCDTLIKQGIAEERLMYYSARALNKLGQHKESNTLLSKCLDLAISDEAQKYYFEKSENFESLRQYSSAIAVCDTAYYLFHTPLALYNIGRLYETGLKNKPKAFVYYKQYVKKGVPSDPEERKVYTYLKEMLEPKKN